MFSCSCFGFPKIDINHRLYDVIIQISYLKIMNRNGTFCTFLLLVVLVRRSYFELYIPGLTRDRSQSNPVPKPDKTYSQ